MEDVKIRLSVLWIFLAVSMSAHVVLMLFEPGTIEQVISGEILEGMDIEQVGLIMLTTWMVPLVMAFLSVTLESSLNRWANMIVGIVVTIFNIWHLTQPCAEAYFQKLLIVITIVVSALIIWLAYRWQED